MKRRENNRRMASTVSEFCTDHGICNASFYNMKKKGLAPDVFYVGNKPLVSHEASARWRKRMEELAKAKEAIIAQKAEDSQAEANKAGEIMDVAVEDDCGTKLCDDF